MITHDGIVRSFGWRPDEPDDRDMKFQLPLSMTATAVPKSVDLRPLCPEVYDQGDLGSCTAQAVGFLCHYNWIQQKKPNPFVPSRLFIYFCERELEGTINYDSGAYIRDGLKVINKKGYPPERHWPYVIRNYRKRPLLDAYTAALKNIVKDYGRVEQDETSMKACLASGFPIVIGFYVYESFMENKVALTGIIPMPEEKESIIGGHAVAIVGYNAQGWIVRNSWGKSWGMDGYCIMPYEYLTDPERADDLWCVRFV